MLQGVNKLNQGAASSKTFPRSCGVGKEYSQLTKPYYAKMRKKKKNMQNMQEKCPKITKNAKRKP